MTKQGWPGQSPSALRAASSVVQTHEMIGFYSDIKIPAPFSWAALNVSGTIHELSAPFRVMTVSQ